MPISQAVCLLVMPCELRASCVLYIYYYIKLLIFNLGPERPNCLFYRGCQHYQLSYDKAQVLYKVDCS